MASVEKDDIKAEKLDGENATASDAFHDPLLTSGVAQIKSVDMVW